MKTPEIFRGLPDSVRRNILSSARPRRLERRQVIFRADDPATETFLLTEGYVKISQLSEDGIETILRLNLPGQLIGSPRLKVGSTYSSTAEALQPSKVLAWNTATFVAAVESQPILLRNATAIIARELLDISTRWCEVSTGTVPQRLAPALTRLIGEIGRKVNGHFEIDLTQETLAQMVAMNQFTLNRQLSKWEAAGLVMCRHQTIVVRDAPGLERLACRGRGPRLSRKGLEDQSAQLARPDPAQDIDSGLKQQRLYQI